MCSVASLRSGFSFRSRYQSQASLARLSYRQRSSSCASHYATPHGRPYRMRTSAVQTSQLMSVVTLAADPRRTGTLGRSRSRGRPRLSNIQSLNEFTIEKVASMLGLVFSRVEVNVKGGWAGVRRPERERRQSGQGPRRTQRGARWEESGAVVGALGELATR